jgi:hypothetical protein
MVISTAVYCVLASTLIQLNRLKNTISGINMIQLQTSKNILLGKSDGVHLKKMMTPRLGLVWVSFN